MQLFQAVIFDFDYTLGDSSSGIIQCVNRALITLGFPPASDEQIRAAIGLSLPDMFPRLAPSKDPILATRFAELFIQRADQVMVAQTVLYPSVPATIAYLRQRGLALGIVSTKFRYRIAAVMEREGLLKNFEVIVGGEDVPAHKPNPASLHLALEQLGCAPGEALYVGDSVVDAEAAVRAGVVFVGVLSGVTPREQLAAYAPLAILNDVSALPSLLEE